VTSVRCQLLKHQVVAHRINWPVPPHEHNPLARIRLHGLLALSVAARLGMAFDFGSDGVS
jgi:hypothetical protein